MTSFEVEPDDLVAHASHLDGLVQRLDTAVAAADTALSPGAYGLLCAFLPPIVNPTGEQAKDTLSASVEGVRASADNIRTTVKAYLDGDDAGAQPFAQRLLPE